MSTAAKMTRAPSVRETFRPETHHGGHDGADGRALRYLSWMHDPDPDDPTYTVDFAYLLREADGAARVERDRHVCGVFPRATWRRLLRDAGFTLKRLPLPHSEVGKIEAFVGKKSAKKSPGGIEKKNKTGSGIIATP